ncbi:hypothetical protein [Vibrio fluvialis]|uniref:hypothetical protein n=1 Tax=Vibrio fluvialis TaxID=676 RepID=UPI001EEB81FF|nr:hypothetical protein [Vibrio fluvialis]ELS8948146.1 hypothetical protein [Vibrio fluvialis]MCG6384379.1 hypothetical protein [Vibrio fluvialis]
MKRYPALHLEIAESAAGPSSPNWPVVQNFPRVCRDAIFSLPQDQAPQPKANVWVVTFDLRKLVELLNPTLH